MGTSNMMYGYRELDKDGIGSWMFLKCPSTGEVFKNVFDLKKVVATMDVEVSPADGVSQVTRKMGDPESLERRNV